MKNKELDAFLKGQLLGQMSACALIGIVLFCMARAGKMNSVAQAEKTPVVPGKVVSPAANDTVQVIRADSLMRSR